jgi:hypothetical protein
VHEVKHDGYRLIVRRDGETVRLFTRRGYNWTDRYPSIAAAAAKLRAKSFTLDGEAVVAGADGVAVFEALHRRGRLTDAILQTFDLLELDGEDLRPCARTWMRPGADAADLEREKFECQFEASKAIASAGTAAEVKRDELDSLCMEAKGWSRSWGSGKSRQAGELGQLDEGELMLLLEGGRLGYCWRQQHSEVSMIMAKVPISQPAPPVAWPSISDFCASNMPESAGLPDSTRRFIQARAVRTASDTSNTRPSASQPSRRPTLMRLRYGH